MKPVLMEICCGSADDALGAYKAGAARIELNSGLFLGGLTPSIGELRVAKANAPIPAMCMVRPRGGGFHYTQLEFETMLADTESLLENGADGVVFGFLHEDGTVDAERSRQLVARAKAKGKATVFHRAIDVTLDWRVALDTLIELGVDRVLSSGQRPDSLWGAETLAEMIRYAAGRIEILPGGGITPGNAADVIEKTGCSQIHFALHRDMIDRSTSGNPAIFFGGALYPPEERFQITDSDALAAFIGGK